MIEGTGFEAGSTVKIGSEATSVEVKSATEIKATTAATAAGKDKVVVTLPDGVPSASATEFPYLAPPTVTSISPTKAPPKAKPSSKSKAPGSRKKRR